MDKRLLEYLQGKISFSEWLDGATSTNAAQQAAVSIRGPTLSSTLPSNSAGSTGFEISQTTSTLRSNESPVQTGQSFKVLGTKYGSVDEFDLVQSPSTSNFEEDGGWEDSEDEEDDDESQGAWPIAEEASGSLLMGIQ